MNPSREIMIVEDDEAIAAGLSLNLKLAGHKPSIARDGQAALDEVDARDFDLILLDINLPRKNGLEVLQAVRESDNLVPVIVLSARDGDAEAFGCRRASGAIASE